MKINAAWHKKHRMPKNPSLEERLKWHKGHMRNCKCREVPEKLLIEMRKRGMVT